METFVVRLWRPAGAGSAGLEGQLRGVVEHVRSGLSRRFEGEAALIATIHEVLSDDPVRLVPRPDATHSD